MDESSGEDLRVETPTRCENERHTSALIETTIACFMDPILI
jgi:hypothetical protein